jgi:SAM-dependent methyltransferase
MPVWKHQPQLDALSSALQQWFETDMGRVALAVERRLLARRLADCFGYHLLQLSANNNLDLYGDCRVQRCFKAGPVVPDLTALDKNKTDARTAFVRCNFDELPFETDSIDVALVHHVPEFSTDPHAVLRELYRVIVPNGRVILIGFNPWSPFGARMAMGRWRKGSVWRNHFFSATRMNDWLQLLGFETESTDYGFHRLPLHRTAHWPALSENDNPWSRHWPFGGIYVITAVKQVSKFIPIKPHWSSARVLTPLSVAKPSASASQKKARAR